MQHSFFTTISVVICVWTLILTFVSGYPTLSFNTKETVLIVGAGPAGLSLALGLSRLGWKVRVLEKRLDLMTRGGAVVGIAPNGLKALEELHPGLRDKIMSLSQGSGPSRSMPWCTMRDVLLEEALKEKNIIIESGKCLEDIVEREEGVTATFRSVGDISSDVDEENMVKIDGAFIVAADGVRSAARRILNLQESTPTGSKIFRGTVDFQSDNECVDDKETNDYRNALLKLKSAIRVKVPTDNRFLLLVVSFDHIIPGRVCWICHTTKDVSVYDGSDNIALTLAEMSAASHDDWPMIRFLLSQSTNDLSFTDTRLVTFSDEELASYNGRWGGTRRVTLVGDAAHAMRAVDGLGASMAYEDSVVLCRFIKSPIDSVDIEDALEKYEKERLPRVEKIHRFQEERMDSIVEMEEDIRKWIYDGV